MDLPGKLDKLSVKNKLKVLIVEPFYGGSHKQLIDALVSYIDDCDLVTLPAKKWHWRARCGVLMLYDKIPMDSAHECNVLFCSSVLNLSELLGIRGDLQALKKVVYFHENQLVYPVREIKERDIQYAYNQITTCLAADVVLFNSEFNKSSFLTSINKIMKILPDFRPKLISDVIAPKCRVQYFPVKFPKQLNSDNMRINKSDSVLHIVWPHRWEFDKGPDDFFSVLFKLKENQIKFKLSVLGESFTDNPAIFAGAKDRLKDEIVHFGYVQSKDEYYEIISSAHVVVSTAKHEFFGVAMLEAAYCGCFPLAPNLLVYPEIYPKECLFSNLDELCAKLELFALAPSTALEARDALNMYFTQYSFDEVMPQFYSTLSNLVQSNKN